MNKHEEQARILHSQGNNCSTSVYKAFLEDTKLDGTIPPPRSIAGKCGAVLAAEKILKECGKEAKIQEFEKNFISRFGYATCIDLMKAERRCNDYVGDSVSLVDKILSE